MRLINLDALVPEDVKVVKDDREWLIPGDLPVTHMVKILKAEKALTDSQNNEQLAEALNGLAEAVRQVLEIRQPGQTAALTFGTGEVQAFLRLFYAAMSAPNAEEVDSPNRAGPPDPAS